MRERRGQAVFEYLVLISTGILLVILIILLLRSNIFAPQEKEIANKSQQISNLTKCLEPGYFNCSSCPDDVCPPGATCSADGSTCVTG